MTIRPPRIWVLLLLANLIVLALPIAGVTLLRIYESALVRQTETELVAQAAVLAAAYRVQRAALGPPGDDERPATTIAGRFDIARRPGLDLARDPIRPSAPDPLAGGPPAAFAARVGEALEPVVRAAQSVTLSAIRITDVRGVVVATSGADLGRSLLELPEVQQAATGALVTLLRKREERATWYPGGISRGAALRVHVAMPVVEGGRVMAIVVLSRTPADIFQAVWGKRWELAGLVLALLGVGAGLAWGASRLITQPLGIVAAQARRIADGETGAVRALARPGTREVAALSDAIARMAATLEQRAVYIRDLAAHVAHEFKTPIAAASAAAELAGEDVSTADRARLLGDVQAGLARLDRLTRRLLELARAEMMTVRDAATELGPLLARVAAERSAVLGAAEGCVQVRAEAVEMMLAGLLDNARDHAAGATVRVSAQSRQGWVTIQVQDDGPGISDADAGHLFDPFFTTARARGGTGMGLPIVRALATGAGGALRLVPTPGGAMFELDLPRAGST